MMHVLWALQSYDGLTMGLSTGINVAGAINIARELKLSRESNIVTILCDTGLRYATKQFNKSFLQSMHLPIASWMDSGEITERDPVLKEAVDKSIQTDVTE